MNLREKSFNAVDPSSQVLRSRSVVMISVNVQKRSDYLDPSFRSWKFGASRCASVGVAAEKVFGRFRTNT